MRNKTYDTKQKTIILEKIKNSKDRFTIKDIYNSLDRSIGLTTIYRLVDKLVIDGIVNKTIEDDNVTYYQYLEECSKNNHFYLKCDKCKQLVHVDCDCVNHILKEHNFTPSKSKIIINGICQKCSSR